MPQDPLTLKLRLDTNDVNIVRTAPQIRSQGACGAFYFGFCRDRIKNQPYKRRRVGRNLRLSRTDPTLCFGQPSPLRCILLSPQGLTTLRGPRSSIRQYAGVLFLVIIRFSLAEKSCGVFAREKWRQRKRGAVGRLAPVNATRNVGRYLCPQKPYVLLLSEGIFT